MVLFKKSRQSKRKKISCASQGCFRCQIWTSGPSSMKGACSFQKHIPYHPATFICIVEKDMLCLSRTIESKTEHHLPVCWGWVRRENLYSRRNLKVRAGEAHQTTAEGNSFMEDRLWDQPWKHNFWREQASMSGKHAQRHRGNHGGRY